jgi:hypothetical protein
LHARIAESAGARQVPCKPERLRAIVDDTRKLMEGINRLTSFLVDEARCSDAVATRDVASNLRHTRNIQDATCSGQHAVCHTHLATRQAACTVRHATRS